MALNSSRYPYAWTPEEAALNVCLAPSNLSEVGERGLFSFPAFKNVPFSGLYKGP